MHLTVPSLRARLVLVTCLAYVVVGLTTLAISYQSQETNLRTQLEVRARGDARILAVGAVDNLLTGNIPTLRVLVSSFQSAQGVSYAAVMTGDGRVVASTRAGEIGRRMRRPLATQAHTVKLAGGDIEGVAPIVQSTDLGTALVVLSGSSINQDLQTALTLDVLVRLIGLAIFAILSLVIATLIVGPVARLAQAARDLQHGRLSSRVPMGGGSELSTLADTFNSMAASLEERIRHLSFLASASPSLPALLRDGDNLASVLAEFCAQVRAGGAGLLPLQGPELPALWYESPTGSECWDEAVRGLLGTSTQAVTVPVPGEMVFVAVPVEGAFTEEEQQLIRSFAYAVGVAAENARLFESQQEALQVKDQFLSIVSHELRTPLTAIKGYAQMLHKLLADDPVGRRFADTIDAQTNRLSRIVDDLLDVTRFARAQFELTRKHMDLRPVLTDIVARYEMLTPNYHVVLRLDDEPLEGVWDQERLEQVLNNLISNAIKYSEPHTTVTVMARKERSELVVSVQDQGMGIPPEEQGQLFERFYRGSVDGKTVKGLGLGLYVTRRIVEAHGGTIGVRSVPGEGSTFHFTLPLARRAGSVGVETARSAT